MDSYIRPLPQRLRKINGQAKGAQLPLTCPGSWKGTSWNKTTC